MSALDRPGGAPAAAPWSALSGPALWGLGAMTAFFLGFGLFAAAVPLDAAATASGVVVAEGDRREVQSLDGGAIVAIEAREGSSVRAGDPLLRFDGAELEAERALWTRRTVEARARLARLIAADAEALAFERDLRELAASVDALDVLDDERAIHQSALAAHRAELAILDRRAAGARASATGLGEVIEAMERQASSLAAERGRVTPLVERGVAPATRLDALTRELDELRADIAARSLERRQAELTIETLDAERARAIEARLARLGSEKSEARERLAFARQRLRTTERAIERLVLRAPIDGRVIDLRYDTIGGVVAEGAPVLDIVPLGERPVVEARLSPFDVDRLEVGQKAQIRLTALPQRFAEPLTGEIAHLAADRSIAENGEAYFTARIAFAEDALTPPPVLNDFTDLQSGAISDVGWTPSGAPVRIGMPAEISVAIAPRTLLEALIEPLSAFWRRALREE